MVRKDYCSVIKHLLKLPTGNRQIQYDNLDMKEMCNKMVPKILTSEIQEHLVDCCADTCRY